jgi:hypothetical protein
MTDEQTLAARKEAEDAIKLYFDDLDKFFVEYIPEACRYATQNVTDTRLKQVEADLTQIAKRLDSSPSLGLFLLDLALSFIPVIGGHLFEYGVKRAFRSRLGYRDVIMGQRHFELFKTEQLLQFPQEARFPSNLI